jgi:predicted acylesterase/phospholipase RssA
VKVKGGGQKPRPGKLAVVCGGGGITGGVFEVGALRALDQALGGGVLNRADLYAGASAGALVATMLAAGLSPGELDDVVVRGARNRRRLPALKRGSVYGIDAGMWARSAAALPTEMVRGFFRSLLPGESSGAADAAFAALGALPPGLFSNEPLADYVETVLDRLGLPKDFKNFPQRLMVTAVNVDSGHRVVFGEEGVRDVPIPKAVQASAALPILFRPVRIADQDFVDGGIERNLPVDVAVQHGATLVVAVNPLVPVVNDPRGGDAAHGFQYLAERGLPAVVDQVFRMLVRSQVLYGLQAMQDRFPEVDLVLVEPEAHDWTMFSYHPMRYSVRERIARHAYEQTRQKLLRDAPRLTELFARHGYAFDARRLAAGATASGAAAGEGVGTGRTANGHGRREGAGSALRAWAKRIEKLPGFRGLAAGSGTAGGEPF